MRLIPLFLALIIQVSSLKFCKNCKHFMPDKLCGQFSALPIANIPYNLVTGKKEVTEEFFSCTVVRSLESLCGTYGHYYEKKDGVIAEKVYLGLGFLDDDTFTFFSRN